jgi:hypothetical protein
MSLPFGTKVYLEDKTLKKVQDLKFGDKVLSIKINDKECLNHSELYAKYLKKDNNDSTRYIEKELISLSSTNVYSVFTIKDYTSFIGLNNNVVSEITPVLISKTKSDPQQFYIKDSRDMSAIIKNSESESDKYYLQSLAAQSFSLNKNIDNSEVFIDSENFLFNEQITQIDSNIKNQPSVSVVLLDNHLLITEHFICFGSVVEGVFLS